MINKNKRNKPNKKVNSKEISKAVKETSEEKWDSPSSALKLILGLILFGLTFGLIFFIGFNSLWFIANEGAPALPFSIDLTTLNIDLTTSTIDLVKESLKNVPHKGYLELTGYPGAQISLESSGSCYAENVGECVKTYKSFYFSLHSSNDIYNIHGKQTASAIVLRKESFIGNLGYYYKKDMEKFPVLPPKNKLFTVKGIAGYHAGDISSEVIQMFEAEGINVPEDVIFLDEGKNVSSLKITLLWFIPVFLLFCLGVYFIMSWVMLLKRRL